MSAHLKEAFDLVINHFNKTEYDELLPFMDGDIIMKKVDDPGSVVGIGNVINYLKGRQAQFRPELTEIVYDGDPWKQSGRMAQVSGTGQMHDKKGAPGVPVRFTFTFTRGGEDEDWQVINAFAARKR
jgi:hypothetical protein